MRDVNWDRLEMGLKMAQERGTEGQNQKISNNWKGNEGETSHFDPFRVANFPFPNSSLDFFFTSPVLRISSALESRRGARCACPPGSCRCPPGDRELGDAGDIPMM